MFSGLSIKTYKNETDMKFLAMRRDIDMLLKHKADCDMQHEQHKEHKKRSDDAMNNLTDSNMLLAKSITDMNVTLTRVVGIIERDAPDIEVISNARTWFKVNKWIFLVLVGVASGILTLLHFYQGIF